MDRECPRFAVVRTGAAYRRIADRGELLALLDSIDSTTEAVILAAFAGHPVTCDQDRPLPGVAAGTYVLQSLAGYALSTGWEDCGVGLFHELAWGSVGNE